MLAYGLKVEQEPLGHVVSGLYRDSCLILKPSMWMWMNLEHSGWNGPNFQVASGVVPPLAWLGSLSSSNLMGREEKEGEERKRYLLNSSNL